MSAAIRRHPWTDLHWGWFERFAQRDWTPPSHLLVWRSPARNALKITGEFQMPNKTFVVLTTRARRGKGGDWYLADQQMQERLTIRGRAVPA